MSHFSVLVFHKKDGRSVDELLAPYDENIVMAPYVEFTKEQAIKKVRDDIEEYKARVYDKYLKDKEAYKEKCKNESHIAYLENEFPLKLKWTDEECYEDQKRWYNEDMILPNGDLLSTYNPNAKWDWYSVGGRWDCYIKNKDKKGTDEDFTGEIVWDKDSIPFAFVEPNGLWHECGQMGWWAIVSNEKPAGDWETEFLEYVKNLDPDTIVTVVDCHI